MSKGKQTKHYDLTEKQQQHSFNTKCPPGKFWRENVMIKYFKTWKMTQCKIFVVDDFCFVFGSKELLYLVIYVPYFLFIHSQWVSRTISISFYLQSIFLPVSSIVSSLIWASIYECWEWKGPWGVMKSILLLSRRIHN